MVKCSGKVTIIGCGAVGSACAYAILLKGVAKELAIIDVNEKRALGEAMDLRHGSVFFDSCVIKSGSDYSLSKDSDIVVITAGAAQKPGQSRLELAAGNAKIMESVIPQIVKYAPNSIILMVTNPVDVMTMLALKLSGFPKNRVFGSGTTLDSSRLRFLIAQSLNMNPKSVHAYILGEHGDSEFAAWSSATVAGIPLSKVPGYKQKSINDAFEHTKNAAYEIIALKGFTNNAIGVAVAHMCKDILTDAKRVTPLSVHLKNYEGVSNVCISVPCVLGAEGIQEILPVTLNAHEKKQFQASAAKIKQTAKNLKI